MAKLTEERRAHIRIDDIECRFKQHLEHHETLETALAENTNLTRQIAENTSELVSLVKGVKGLRTLIVWAAPIVAGAAAVIAWIKVR